MFFEPFLIFFFCEEDVVSREFFALDLAVKGVVVWSVHFFFPFFYRLCKWLGVNGRIVELDEPAMNFWSDKVRSVICKNQTDERDEHGDGSELGDRMIMRIMEHIPCELNCRKEGTSVNDVKCSEPCRVTSHDSGHHHADSKDRHSNRISHQDAFIEDEGCGIDAISNSDDGEDDGKDCDESMGPRLEKIQHASEQRSPATD